VEVSGGWVHWHFTDWKPTDELSVLYVTAVPTPDNVVGATPNAPKLDTVAQWKAWEAFAKRNHYAPEIVESVRKLNPNSTGRPGPP
jgi:hypothetical protein